MKNFEFLEKAIEEIANNENHFRFSKLLKLCENLSVNIVSAVSHYIFKTPWQGDPRINLQKLKGNFAKPCQVRQVLRALRKSKELEEQKADKKNE